MDPLLYLVDLLMLIDLDALVTMPNARETFSRLKDIRRLAGRADNVAIMEYVRESDEPLVRVFGVGCISPDEATLDQISELSELLLKEGENLSLRLAIAGLFQRIEQHAVVRPLLKVIVRAPNLHLRRVTAEAVRDTNADLDWQERTRLMLDVLEAEGAYREHLDFEAITLAISPDLEAMVRNRYLLADHILKLAPSYGEQMQENLAGMIVVCCGNSHLRAIDRIKRIAQQSDEFHDSYRILLNEVSRVAAPAKEHELLQRQLSEPLNAINDQVRLQWRQASVGIKYQIYLKTAFSIVAGLAGTIALGAAIYGLFSGESWNVVALGGLAGILSLALALFSDRTADIQQRLVDVGVFGVVYGGFSQRLLGIQHFYSALSHEDRLTVEHLQESDTLINAAMKDAIEGLSVIGTKRNMTLEDLIDQYT